MGTEFFFGVHEHLLTFHSDFFKKALDKKWKEATERMVRLPGIDSDAFQIFAKWLYTGRVYSRTSKYAPWGCPRLCACYSLGDYLQATDFQDAVIDAPITVIIGANCTPLMLVCCVYPLSREESAYRKLYRDLINTLNRRSFYFIPLHKVPRDFLEDVITQVFSKSTDGINFQSATTYLGGKDKCEYHEHKRLGTPCYKIKFDI